MPYGLIKATNYYNKLEAWKLWRETARTAQSLGLDDLVIDLAPQPQDGWHKIDVATARLRNAIAERRLEGALQRCNTPRRDEP